MQGRHDPTGSLLQRLDVSESTLDTLASLKLQQDVSVHVALDANTIATVTLDTDNAEFLTYHFDAVDNLANFTAHSGQSKVVLKITTTNEPDTVFSYELSVELSMPCAACDAGTYKPEVSNSVCSACTNHSSSRAGAVNATQCICNDGFAGPPGGPCTSCSSNQYVDVATASARCPWQRKQRGCGWCRRLPVRRGIHWHGQHRDRMPGLQSRNV